LPPAHPAPHIVRPKLKGTLFQKDLGTIYDKNLRVEALTPLLADAMGLSAAKATAAAAAALCKADLATHTVTEMTALAGIMGQHYALKQGLPQDVADAVFEAVLPRQAGDVLPASPAGIVVAVADRLDSLVGLVAAVGAPSATADPYGLRRAAYGMLQVRVCVWGEGMSGDLSSCCCSSIPWLVPASPH
jgi:glycyl-tRNA synthetase